MLTPCNSLCQRKSRRVTQEERFYRFWDIETYLAAVFHNQASLYLTLIAMVQEFCDVFNTNFSSPFYMKLNGRLMDSECCYMPSFDKLEQVFEFLQAALTLAEVSFETDVDLMLNVGASDFFDEVIHCICFSKHLKNTKLYSIECVKTEMTSDLSDWKR